MIMKKPLIKPLLIRVSNGNQYSAKTDTIKIDSFISVCDSKPIITPDDIIVFQIIGKEPIIFYYLQSDPLLFDYLKYGLTIAVPGSMVLSMTNEYGNAATLHYTVSYPAKFQLYISGTESTGE